MSMIHVNRDRRALGQFSPEDVTAALQSGQLLPTDLGWREGMESWQPLADFLDLPEAGPVGALVPGDPPLSAPVAPPVAAPEAPGTEPAWERREALGMATAAFQTVKQVLGSPATTFRNLKKTGGYLEPLMFSYPLSVISGLITLFYQQVYQRFLPKEWLPTINGAAFDDNVLSLIYVIPLLFVAYLVQPFVVAGICHLGLMLVGGLKAGFETTFRVVCYFFGAFAVVGLVPFPPMEAVSLGLGVILLTAMMTYLTIGFREAHGVGTPAALVAALMPPTLCCACGMAIVAGVAALFAGAAAAGN